MAPLVLALRDQPDGSAPVPPVQTLYRSWMTSIHSLWHERGVIRRGGGKFDLNGDPVHDLLEESFKGQPVILVNFAGEQHVQSAIERVKRAGRLYTVGLDKLYWVFPEVGLSQLIKAIGSIKSRCRGMGEVRSGGR